LRDLFAQAPQGLQYKQLVGIRGQALGGNAGSYFETSDMVR